MFEIDSMMASLTGNWEIAISIGSICGVLIILHGIVRHKYSYWERKGFETQPDFIYILGHFKKLLIDRICFADFVEQLYKSSNEPLLPFIGIYGIFRPILLIRDPKLIQAILIKDFAHFTDRKFFFCISTQKKFIYFVNCLLMFVLQLGGVHCDEINDPLSAHIFALPFQKWKNMRSKLSPAFSSGKLKAMFSTLVDCGTTLQNHIEVMCNRGELLDIREIAASHTTNVIAFFPTSG